MPPRWSHVVLHHSAGHDGDGLDLKAIERWHVSGRGWRDVGYHWLAEQVLGRYVVIQGRPLYLAGAHAIGWNSKAIGVCLVGNFQFHHPPDEQLQETAELVAGLCGLLDLPVDHVLAHRDVHATECPGRHFDIVHFRVRVARILALAGFGDTA